MEATTTVWYLGIRKYGGVEVKRWAQHRAGEIATVLLSRIAPLDLRLDLANHSPTGFEWGYGGSGPAQLALALLADALENEAKALQVYQSFKWRIVAKLPVDGWLINRREIVKIAQHISAEQEAYPHPLANYPAPAPTL